jgi:hypothetical protein
MESTLATLIVVAEPESGGSTVYTPIDLVYLLGMHIIYNS